MPTQEHSLEEQSKELDRLFWAKIENKKEDNTEEAEAEEKKVDEEWQAMRTWLETFDAEMKGSIVLMCKPAKDHTKPFAEKYEAREILESMLGQIKQTWLDQSDVMKAVKALIYNRLGQNYFDAEEISESER